MNQDKHKAKKELEKIYNDKFKWEKDDRERKIPYIQNTITNEWTRINNLHVHSKDLKSCLSIPL